MYSTRRRTSPALTIPQTQRWIKDNEVGGSINYLRNSDATKNVNEVRALRTRKK